MPIFFLLGKEIAGKYLNTPSSGYSAILLSLWGFCWCRPAAGLRAAPCRGAGEAQCCLLRLGHGLGGTSHCGTDGWDTGGRYTAFPHTDKKAEAEKLKEVSENLCKNQEQNLFPEPWSCASSKRRSFAHSIAIPKLCPRVLLVTLPIIHL